MKDLSKYSAYGGSGWSPRKQSHRDEIGTLWAKCGINTQFKTLKSVIVHKPGPEITELADPDAVQMLEIPDHRIASEQHDSMAKAFEDNGVEVHYVEPAEEPSPNLMFVADLMFMTPEGVLLARPASTVRAGEERWVARKLADIGIPIVRTITGKGVFEGADAAWVDEETVIVATGHRTNPDGAAQIASTLDCMGIDVIHVGLPHGSMHLMGTLRIMDEDLALCWPERVPFDAVAELKERGFDVNFIPDIEEAKKGMALNVVTLSPGKILMPAGNSVTEDYFNDLGIECVTVKVDELAKAAGAVGCLTGILEREMG
ncbi:amidinotransferase [Candidatus Bathyarchaeota archaeon]|nr:amidinotransferase [Candidatus Bathyarchaeota archaeon]